MSALSNLNQQYIGGRWRDGSSAKTLTDSNPFNGRTVASFKLANLKDLDEFHRSAAAAQKIWAAVSPFEKRAVLERGVAWIEKNEADITELIIEELGGTRLKAFIEIFLVKNSLKEANEDEGRDLAVSDRWKRKSALPRSRGSGRSDQPFQCSIYSEHAVGGSGIGRG
jgi:acyl-CoA reductase-like NAD-dependent aldehyde dehydrogenase